MNHPLGAGAGVGVLDGKMDVVADNFDISDAITAYFDVYDPNTGTWTEKALLPNYVSADFARIINILFR
jgi:hypothetical protein